MNLFKYINHYPLYVPEENRAVLAVLAEKGVPDLISELDRLSSLGSSWAAATLAYLSLLPSSNGTRDPKRAIELCTKPAADGDPYSLFVLAWARFLLTRDLRTAGQTMLEASNKRFLPAIMAMGFFAWPQAKVALGFVNEAARRGHKAAWAWRCRLYRSGRHGPMKRILGILMIPLARFYYAVALAKNPLCDNVLLVDLVNPRPVYRPST